MTVVLPAPVADLKQRYDALSEEDKRLLSAIIERERTDTGWEAVPWPMEELERRIRRADEDCAPGIPLDEARVQIKAELARRREARVQ